MGGGIFFEKKPSKSLVVSFIFCTFVVEEVHRELRRASAAWNLLNTF
jgi:hypothetical protein